MSAVHTTEGHPKLPQAALAAWERIDADFDDHLEPIRRYLRQPSVSGTGEGMDAAAEATAELIEIAGGRAEIVATPGHAAVIGTIEGEDSSVLRYGMYDVQPAEEPDWTSPPFAAEIRSLPGMGPCIVGRGAQNSKGALASFLLAISSLRAVAELPVTIKLLLDGEEELGSPNLPRVVDDHRAELAAAAAFDLDLSADRSGRPEVHLGCKGILSIKLTCRGGAWGGPTDRALHSSLGAVVASPTWELARALAALIGPGDTPRIPGVGDGRMQPEDEEWIRALIEDFDPSAFLSEYELHRYKNGSTDAESLVRALVYGAALNLNGMSSGYPAGGKTIIPHEASAILDLRLPYGVDHEEVMRSTTTLVAEAAPEVNVEFPEFCPPARTSASSPVARAMIRSHGDAGPEPRVWPNAPWWAPYFLFEQNIGLPFAIGGAGHGGRAHAADEYATVEGLRDHMRHSVAFLYRIAEELNA
jgi:acetylornithine deacetylase/succinyl-diaminopimelate desuccinylase-like protein